MKFQVGDKVICKEGFDNTEESGGAGYEPSKRFTVGRITEFDNSTILWPIDGTHGVYSAACELYPINPLYEIVNNLRKEIKCDH